MIHLIYFVGLCGPRVKLQRDQKSAWGILIVSTSLVGNIRMPHLSKESCLRLLVVQTSSSGYGAGVAGTLLVHQAVEGRSRALKVSVLATIHDDGLLYKSNTSC